MPGLRSSLVASAFLRKAVVLRTHWLVARTRSRSVQSSALRRRWFALPAVTISSPASGAHYKRGARILASFACREAGMSVLIAACTGTVPNGRRIDTASTGTKSFTVIATDKAGNHSSRTVHYTVKKKKKKHH